MQTDKVLKQERKVGEFTMSFRIPEQYERKWKEYYCNEGVLIIKYDKDSDES